MNEETFWILRKPGVVSKLERCSRNPIRTSYQLLWDELKCTERSNVAIQNTMRRILESYFKVLGGVDLNKLEAEFDGKSKLVCKSLCSWMNAGSHFAFDDMHYSNEESSIAAYRQVFGQIFVNQKHTAHYEMMMGEPIKAGSMEAE